MKSSTFGLGLRFVIYKLSLVLPTFRVGYQAGKPIESVLYCLNSDDNMKKCSNFWLFSWRNVRIQVYCDSRDFRALLLCSGEKSETIFYIPGFGTAFFLLRISSFKTFGILPG